MRSLCLPMALLFTAGCSIENTFAAQHWLDTWEQVPTDAVDILFVVDDSYSMEEEQQALAGGFDSFIAELEGANSEFHIGVVSTSQDSDDPDRGKLMGDPPFLTTSDDYATEFVNRVTVGIGGSDKEKGLEAAAMAVSPELLLTHNVGFLRPEADLVVIFVSDEDDCSDEGRLDGREARDCYVLDTFLEPVPNLVSRIHDAKNDGESVQIGAIIGPFDSSCADAYPGRRYADAVLQTGGLLSSICEPDWSTVLYDLGLNALGILSSFKLTYAADVATLQITIDEVPIQQDDVNGWTYDWQHWVVTFHGTALPERGATIVAEYDVAPYAAPAEE